MSTTERSASKQADEPLIEVVNRQRLHPIDRAQVIRLSREVLLAIGEPASSLCIAFIRDRRMRELNRDYRGIDRPTDVLSFNSDEGESGAEAGGRFLGDMAISVETAERYAAEHRISLEREIGQLVIHGTLHLAGYDHETDNGEMNRLEKRLRRRLLDDVSGQPAGQRP